MLHSQDLVSLVMTVTSNFDIWPQKYNRSNLEVQVNIHTKFDKPQGIIEI